MENHKISGRDNWLKILRRDFYWFILCDIDAWAAALLQIELRARSRACRSSRPVQLPTSDRRDHECDKHTHNSQFTIRSIRVWGTTMKSVIVAATQNWRTLIPIARILIFIFCFCAKVKRPKVVLNTWLDTYRNETNIIIISTVARIAQTAAWQNKLRKLMRPKTRKILKIPNAMSSSDNYF